MSVLVQPLAPEALVALVNDWGTRPREVAGLPAPPADQLPASVPGPGSRPSPATAPGPATAKAGRAHATPDADGRLPVTHEEAIAAADRLHPIFAAPDLIDRVAAVNAILAETAAHPELVAADGDAAGAWRVADPGHALLASAALSLYHHLLAHPDRMGTCADRQCADVYIDASPAGHRRFCSVTCQNRTRVAAFRERRRS